MKKLLLLLLLCPLVCMAEFLPGTIILNNGTTKSGLIEIPAKHNKDVVKFKTDKKDKEEKISIDDVKEFTVTAKDNSKSKYITLKLADLKAFASEYKVADKKSWVRVEREGEMNVVLANIDGPVYYLNKRGEDVAKFLAVFYGGFVAGQFKAMKTIVGFMMKDECPQLEEALLKEDFKKRGVNLVAEKYEELCGND